LAIYISDSEKRRGEESRRRGEFAESVAVDTDGVVERAS